MKLTLPSLATVVLVCLVIIGETSAQDKPAGETIAKGKTIYARRCSFCHGTEGKGDGPVADYLNPRPRDFTSGVYKLRTTKSGEAPLDEDLLQTISRGIPGTAMQGFDNVLTEAERRQLIAFIKTLASERFDAAPEKAEIGSEKKGSAEKGKELYQKAKCWECHGQKGRGDGSKASQLTDDWGFPILPADLTKGWRYKGGTTFKDIFGRFSTGMDGTPMPSYADALNEEDRWHLATYIKSLIEGEKIGTEVVIRSKRIDRELPLDPSDPVWHQAEPIGIPLSGQVIAPPRWENASIDRISVRSVYNDKAIGFLLEWNDRFKDTLHKDEALAPRKDTYVKAARDKGWTLRDAAAIQFPAVTSEGQERPYFFYGQSERPVVLWQWKADWNEDPKRRTPVEVLTATGPKNALVPMPEENQTVLGKGVYQEGQWKLVIVTPRTGKGKDISFQVGKPIPIAFFAWDGSNGEQGLMMSLSSWFYLMLEAPTPPTVYLYTFLAILGGFGAEVLLVRWARNRCVTLGREPLTGPAGASHSLDH